MVEPDFKVYLIWSLPGSVFSEDIKNKQTNKETNKQKPRELEGEESAGRRNEIWKLSRKEHKIISTVL